MSVLELGQIAQADCGRVLGLTKANRAAAILVLNEAAMKLGNAPRTEMIGFSLE